MCISSMGQDLLLQFSFWYIAPTWYQRMETLSDSPVLSLTPKIPKIFSWAAHSKEKGQKYVFLISIDMQSAAFILKAQ